MNTTDVVHRYTVTAECWACGAESYGTWLANRALTVTADCDNCGGRVELLAEIAAGLGKACD